MEKKKRIFVALPISKSLQKNILSFEKKYKNLPLRWIAPKNLHITLIPPWYGSNNNAVSRKLKAINVKNRASNILFERVEFGPNSKRPRLIWAVGEAPKEALDLKKNLEKALKQKSEYRQWKLHFTIARFREKDFYKFSVKNLDEHVEWKEKVNSFVLMESRLSPKGADYKILKKHVF